MDDELEYLRWFYVHADFGPAHGDVMHWLNQRYHEETGKEPPDGYKEEE